MLSRTTILKTFDIAKPARNRFNTLGEHDMKSLTQFYSEVQGCLTSRKFSIAFCCDLP